MNTLTLEDAVDAITRKLDGVEDRNSDLGKAIRQSQIYYNQLQKGKITKKEYEDQIETLKNKYDLPYLPKNPNALYKTGPRPNKERSKMSPSDFNLRNQDNVRRSESIDQNTYEKLERHLDICNTTDDYKEYQVHRRALCKILGLPNDATLTEINLQKNRDKNNTGRIFLRAFSKSKDQTVKIENEKEMTHTSDVNGLKSLTPRFRSKDGVLYADKRAYFYKGKEGTRFGPSSLGAGNKPVYQLSKKGINAHADPELRGSEAYYISSDDKIPVKQTKKSNSVKKESVDTKVDDMKLRVYEAFEDGVITAKDKYIMLEYLNLDNYENE